MSSRLAVCSWPPLTPQWPRELTQRPEKLPYFYMNNGARVCVCVCYENDVAAGLNHQGSAS